MVTSFVFSTLGHVKCTQTTAYSFPFRNMALDSQGRPYDRNIFTLLVKNLRIFQSQFGGASVLEAILMTQVAPYF